MDSQVKSIIKEALNLYASRGIDDEMFYTEDRDIFIFVRSGGMVAQTILPIGDSFAEFEVTHYNLHPNSIAEIVQTAIMHREIMLACIKALDSTDRDLDGLGSRLDCGILTLSHGLNDDHVSLLLWQCGSVD